MGTETRNRFAAQDHLSRAEELAKEASSYLADAKPGDGRFQADAHPALRAQADALSSLARTYAVLAETALQLSHKESS